MKFSRTVLAVALAALLSLGSLKAQCPQNNMPVNEVGFRLFNLSDASSFGGFYVAEQTQSLGFLNGIHYKRYNTFGAFRASLGLTRYDYTARRGCPDCLRTEGKVNGFTARLGYEWFAVLGAVEPYFGLDAIGVYGKYNSETFSTNSAQYQESTDNRERRGIGFGPVAGFRLYLGYAVSLGAETSLDMLFVGKSTRISQISPETDTYARTVNGFTAVYQPINSLSINVMF